MFRRRAWSEWLERGAAVAAVFVVLAAGARAFASFREVPRHELVLAADDVVLVEILSVSNTAGRVPHAAGEVPFTEATARVVRAFRGGFREGDAFAFRAPGGVHPDGRTLMVSTSPALEGHRGGRALAFVERDAFGPGLHGLAHKALGLYRVETARGGADVVRGVTGYPIERDLPVAEVPNLVIEATSRRRR